MNDATMAAVVALVHADPRPGPRVAEELETGTAPMALLERALAGTTDGAGQQSLLLAPADPSRALAVAAAELAAWRAEGIAVSCVLDSDYPHNLRAVHDRPPLLFTAGRRRAGTDRAVAVIGSRRASAAGRERARAIAEHLVDQGFTVVSGLAAGIDRAAHIAALDCDGHTIAVIGTGLRHSYPPEHAELQAAIAARDLVVSPFWPGTSASRKTFPRRNGVMSGLSLASVIVEAGMTSGARIQARLSLAQGRPVFLACELLSQPWAQSLAARPSVHVYGEPSEITDVMQPRIDTGALVP
ncbi:MAG: DNA-protecting protein DprA [Actinomycetota bacterium]|nr:DNA-protecting protein DprA [Actinomycetota bacterium]